MVALEVSTELGRQMYKVGSEEHIGEVGRSFGVRPVAESCMDTDTLLTGSARVGGQPDEQFVKAKDYAYTHASDSNVHSPLPQHLLQSNRFLGSQGGKGCSQTGHIGRGMINIGR